ncbi:rRNA (guanine-N1)-methyltransferase [Shewanella sp. AS16]|uniref:pilus assembly protein n=1 Tax=Shewanella sp. AS16 TaxID=2907625 RepID=UPI001F188AE1|nr:PilC/PilY family type IV pilus protein [Shewanella sp. AS16]MCE9685277.1 rRNA (guanine-N1)-methyltransferase [Shewanella sp. AS16]
MMTKRLVFALLFSMLGTCALSWADDTELYVFESSTRTGARAKVLVIFDNSGSMATIEEDAAGSYDPNTVYPAVGSSNAYQGRMLYFTKGSGIDNTSLPTPDSPSEARRFLDSINGCNQSKAALDKYGRFTGFLREYNVKGKTGSWIEVPENNGANIEIIDCWEDIEAVDPANATGIANGFPVDALKVDNKAYPYNHNSDPASSWANAIGDAKSTNFGTGEPVTLYTDNYLRWYTLVQLGQLPVVPQSRLEVAKEAIKNIVITTPSVDFGLAVFNLNYPYEGDRDGGRIVSGIKQMSATAKSDLLSTIDKLPADTNTPLCETLFEAYNYFAGKPIVYGHKDSDYNFLRGDNYWANQPPYDTSIEAAGSYVSPFQVCPGIAYVIYVTDGVPTVDSHADTAIAALTSGASSEGDYSSFSTGLATPSSLPALASYMYHNDLVHVNDANGEDQPQTVRTFTIGFSAGADDAAPLLQETAKRGGGKYFAARNSLALQDALSDALTSILEIDSSFTSPSIASNNFDRTQTFDAAYYAMFLPGKGPRWSGNLKKLKVTPAGTLVDANGIPAIGSDGNIKDNACTFWSDCTSVKDGNSVELGGAAAKLKQSVAQRVLYSNLGTGGALLALNKTNAAAVAGGEAELATYMGTTDLDNSFSWLKGYDVDDEVKDSDVRTDVMGDPLHSKPLAINFGSPTTPDVRVILGTNQGLLHMFQDAGNSVSESWAFMPYELLPNINKLRENKATGGHSVYGMDASPVAYVKSNASGVETVWLFVGMRRGGSSYYALDITTPDSPKFMWRISAETSGFAELGQSWSEPVITRIPGYTKPVLIFGGGYDLSYDATPSASPSGRGVYIVDAETGSLLHTFAPTAASGVTQLPGIDDSIPNTVAVLDSNNDGDSDRIYATDTGGYVWRMDMPGSDKTTWTGFKFADLGGSTAASDRRFFAEPVVAQTVFSNISEVTVSDGGTSTVTKSYQNVPYDAVTVGTGNRAHPSGTEVADMYYVLQDRNVVTRSFDGTVNAIPEPITLAQLYNVTSAAPSSESENIAFGQKLGWYYDFAGVGEKSLTAGLIVGGKVYFTSYVPPVNAADANVCVASGEGRLYVFDLHKGTRTYEQLYIELGERVPDTPQIIIPPPENVGDPSYIYIIGVGKGECVDNTCSGTVNVGSGLGVNKIYYHVDE